MKKMPFGSAALCWCVFMPEGQAKATAVRGETYLASLGSALSSGWRRHFNLSTRRFYRHVHAGSFYIHILLYLIHSTYLCIFIFHSRPAFGGHLILVYIYIYMYMYMYVVVSYILSSNCIKIELYKCIYIYIDIYIYIYIYI